jgi:hypothetical protein
MSNARCIAALTTGLDAAGERRESTRSGSGPYEGFRLGYLLTILTRLPGRSDPGLLVTTTRALM